MSSALLWAVVACFTLLPSTTWAATDRIVITLLSGNAEVKSNSGAVWRKLAQGDTVGEGSVVRLRPPRGGRMELTFPDQSLLRLHAPARVELKQFVPSDDYAVRLRLLAGRAWSSVRKKINQRRSHHLFAGTAVLGVRGTSFDTEVTAADSVDVRLFSGSVAVAVDQPSTAGGKGSRRLAPPREVAGPNEVAGPKEISMHQWLLVLEAMQRVRIAADGTLGVAKAMEIRQERQDAWVAWNLDRDKATAPLTP
ncbi:MAG: FecR family protein [Mariprofundales bacterium]